MVVKSYSDKEKQQQKRQQVQLQPSECNQKKSKKALQISDLVKHLKSNLDYCNTKSNKKVSGRTGFLFFCISLVISFFSQSAHGVIVNSTLSDDLSTRNNNHRDAPVNAIADNSTTPSALTNESSTTTSTSTVATTIDSTSETTTSTSSSLVTELPPHVSNDNGGKIGNDNESNDKKKNSSHNDKGHARLTIPIHAISSDSTPIIVKLGNVIYEVISNGTVSTNEGSYTVPIVKSKSTASRIGLYSQMTATIIGLRVEESVKPVSYSENGASKIMANYKTTIRFFGKGFTNKTIIRFVAEEGERETDCDDVTSTKYFHFDQVFGSSAVAQVQIPPLNEGDQKYYICVREEDDPDMPWIHQGPEEWIVMTTYKKWLPVWAHVILLCFLLILSGLFSGLNLGLMAIDRTELRIIINAGSDEEKRHAQKIRPLRDRGNYLLCSLLLGNVLVNATLTILLDDLTSGLIAVVGSTLGIVIFGEIVPQAVCSRHGLAIGAKTVWITKLFMLLTFPMSYPISVILDKVLGEEIGNVYNRERLKELIRLTQGDNDLGKDEMNIISGALDLKQKTVVDVMTRLEDVYMLPIDSILDFDTVSEIMSNGYSRIPVYENQRGNVISLLYTKDLAFVDPDDKMPLRTICEFYSNPCHFVFENVTLNVLFNVFKQGNKGHMAFVQRIKINDKVDPTYEVIGLVTMEDVIEELIQEEINDETDVWGDAENRRHSREDYSAITDMPMTRLKKEGTTVSPQLTLAAFQYLSTAVEEFNDHRISKTVLERMLKQNIYFHIKIKNKDSAKTDPSTIIYERGKAADYFIMILEGKVHAEIGKENLVFESGPFSYFGTKSLIPVSGEVQTTPILTRKISQTSFSDSALQPAYIPDYTVRAITDLTYFQISRSMYIAAKQATLLEKSYASADVVNCDDKIVDDANWDEKTSNMDGRSKEKALTMGKPTNRSSISEKRSQELKERNNKLIVEPVTLSDNNNISLRTVKNMERTTEEKEEELNRNNNMSHVIIVPKDEKPSDTNKIIVGGDEKRTEF